MKKRLLLIASAVLTSFMAFSQQKPCGTDEMMRQIWDANPAAEQQYNELNDYSRWYTQNVYIPNAGAKAPVLQIPIVFHVIHNYGSENISDATILNALTAMNNHWRKRDADTVNIAAPFNLIHKDMEVEFVLAKKDPNGDCSTGITRYVSELTNSAGENVKALTKADIDWPRSRYLNVWIVANIASGAGGYSFYPSGSTTSSDGIVVLAGQLSALAHEAGHWANLPHLWGNTNDNNLASNCGTDDGVIDTPNTRGQNSCNTSRNSCTDDPVPFLDIYGNAIWNTEIHDNTQNYMDYAFCSSENFTEGQKARVRAAFDTNIASRNNLWQPANLTATGINSGFTCEPTPIIDFNLPYEYFCTGLSVNVQNNTYNYNTVDFDWNFGANSDPSSTSAAEPTLAYTEPGKYDITLTASNTGGTRSKTKAEIAKVLSGVSIPNVGEGFENAAFPVLDATNWEQNWFMDGSWERTTVASTEGAASAKLDIKTVNGTHRMISPMMDLTQMECDNLTFDLAYASRTNNTVDKFSVKISKTCGRTWPASSTYEVTKQDIAPHTPVISGDYIPGASDWLTHTISLANLKSEDAVLFMFEVETAGGNTIYLDNVSFGCAKVDNVNEAIAFNLDVFPNPANGDANIRISGTLGKMNIMISDLAGKNIASQDITVTGNSHQLSINEMVGANLEQGVYLISVQSGDHIKTTKLIIK